jgi:hypothetical protein
MWRSILIANFTILVLSTSSYMYWVLNQWDILYRHDAYKLGIAEPGNSMTLASRIKDQNHPVYINQIKPLFDQFYYFRYWGGLIAFISWTLFFILAGLNSYYR